MTPKKRLFDALKVVDGAARRARGRYVTEGQDGVYSQKLAEARLLLADPESQPGAHILAEVGVTAATAIEVAEVIDGLGAAWLTVKSPAIEHLRVSAKKAVRDAALAATGPEDEAAFAAMDDIAFAAEEALGAV